MSKKVLELSSRIQDAFVYLCITDKSFLQIAYGSIKSSYLTGEVRQDLLDICYNYYAQFNDAPQNHFHDELVRFLSEKDEEVKKHYLDYVVKLTQMDAPSTAYIISCVNSFVQTREFEQALVKSAKFSDKGNLEKAREIMSSALRSGILKEEVGLKYFDSDSQMYLDQNRSTESITTLGFPALDEKLPRGLCRTDFVVVFGGFKGKKSWCLIHLGVQALMRGLNVVHISHELSLEDTEMRYDRMVGCLHQYPSKAESGIQFQQYYKDGAKGEVSTVYPNTIQDSDYVLSVRKQLSRLGGNLIIKKYPMGLCTMREIKRYLEYLENYEGFIADVVINDYIEKMRLDTSKTKRNDMINDMYIESKGIADERKLLMITASQVTREALEKAQIRQKDSAEDIRKIGNVDLAIGISADKLKTDKNLMRAFVLANRHGEQEIGCEFNQNLDIGQFCITTWPLKETRRQ